MDLKKIILKTAFFSVLLFTIFSCSQEKMMFHPTILPVDYRFSFKNRFQEFFIKVDKNTVLNGLLFHADHPKGLVFFLHGSAGSIDSCERDANVYLMNNYDFFILDYRGFGKSQGRISNEKILFNDIQIVYDSLKTLYNEKNITLIGYSLGTGLAAKIATSNNPKMLILDAPYYNLPDLVRQHYKFVPPFFVKYKFRTDVYISKVGCPIMLFHGNKDEVINFGSSLKLKELLKQGDQLFILDGQNHNGINDNEIYQSELRKAFQ